MNFEIDLTNAVKIVIKKDNNHLIEYAIDNGKIIDVSIIEKEKTMEEKVEELKSNPDVQKVSKLMELSDKAGVLTKMAEGKYTSITDVIKDNVINEPIDEQTAIKRIPILGAKEKLEKAAKKSAEIMKENEIMDEVSKDFREVIAKKLSADDEQLKKGEIDVSIDKALEIKDRGERIKYLKDTINRLNKAKDNERTE